MKPGAQEAWVVPVKTKAAMLTKANQHTMNMSPAPVPYGLIPKVDISLFQLTLNA